MKILADENIPYVSEAFGTLGEVETMPGRATNAASVKDADILLVRSITKVNAHLLDGSAVRFVATATIGEDHIDKAYLAARGIAFASAPGSNANSVGQYIAAALLELAEHHGLDLGNLKLGIVGVGNVGTCILAKATALGLRCVLNDPPLARDTGDPKYRPIDDVFGCDIVTLHVPLTKDGSDPTHHLVNEDFLRKLKPGAILINTSRGPVADGGAIKRAFAEGRLKACVLDVWENEPNVDVELIELVSIATPHIAGYSFDGKVNGTRMIYEAACRFLEIESAWNPAPLLPPPECPNIISPKTVRDAVRAVYDIMGDDTDMRGLAEASVDERPKLFDRLRKEYPRRREFFNTLVTVQPGDPGLKAQLKGLGFRVERTSS